jgi:hypothetical protein
MHSHLGSFTSQDWLNQLAAQQQAMVPYADPSVTAVPIPVQGPAQAQPPAPVPTKPMSNMLLWAALGIGALVMFRSGGFAPTTTTKRKTTKRRPAKRKATKRKTAKRASAKRRPVARRRRPAKRRR